MNEFDWDNLRLFLAVARSGGLAPAAVTTGKSSPTLGRRMLALERHLGRDLFHRKPRGYELTEDGEAFLKTAEALEAKLAPVLETDMARPLIKISAGTWVTHLLCRHVSQISVDDAVRLRFISAETPVDIGRREAVIGIRNQRPDGPGLAGRKIGPVSFAVYATDKDVKRWACVIGATPSAKWVQSISENAPKIEVTQPRNALDLAVQGTARVVLPTFIGDHFQSLSRISSTIPELDHNQWLTLHHEDRFIPEVRHVIDRIYEVLKTANNISID